MRKTKIICTLGPSTRTENMIEKLVKAGMNVARLNFSHGTHEYHRETMAMIKNVREKMNLPIAILLDTKGPEIRTGLLSEKVKLKSGDTFTLTTEDMKGTKDKVSITHKTLPSQIPPNTTILIDDGKIRLKSISCTDTEILCSIEHGGELGERKGINIPGVSIAMPYLSDADKADLVCGIECDVDFIAASFVRNRQDVIDMRNFLNYHGGRDIKIIAKIENTEGVDNFEDILDAADGIMVARGDMGVEIEYERLPGLQKRFIKKCYSTGKTVITATQMLESMINSPTPTRAEITDVANAVFDGTSAVMLSGETATGNYPVETVAAMAKIAEQAELDKFEMLGEYTHEVPKVVTVNNTNAICDAASSLAADIKAKAVIVPTKHGRTVRNMSKFRPQQPIVAPTPVKKTYYQLAMTWGAYPVLAKMQHNTEELFMHSIDCARMIGLVEDGDLVVLAAGIPMDTRNSTNILKVAIVGERD